MKIIVISTLDTPYYEASDEQQINDLNELLSSIKKLKEEGVILDIYGVPGVEKTIYIIEAESIYHVEELFSGPFQSPYMKNELYYVSDFVKAIEEKRERMLEKTKG